MEFTGDSKKKAKDSFERQVKAEKTLQKEAEEKEKERQHALASKAFFVFFVGLAPPFYRRRRCLFIHHHCLVFGLGCCFRPRLGSFREPVLCFPQALFLQAS